MTQKSGQLEKCRPRFDLQNAIKKLKIGQFPTFPHHLELHQEFCSRHSESELDAPKFQRSDRLHWQNAIRNHTRLRIHSDVPEDVRQWQQSEIDEKVGLDWQVDEERVWQWFGEIGEAWKWWRWWVTDYNHNWEVIKYFLSRNVCNGSMCNCE